MAQNPIINPGPRNGTGEMGIGVLGFSNTVFKRKFRYTLKIDSKCPTRDDIPEHYVKVASRPNLGIEEVELNFLNAKKWIPGKATWENLTVTYIDVATQQMKPLYDWLATMYDFTDPVQLNQGHLPDDYSGTATLTMWDGCGSPLETWLMEDMWPTAINFGDLDYSSSEECTVELTMRYSQVSYKAFCPDEYTPDACCTPCGSGGAGGGGGGAPAPAPGVTLPATGGPAANPFPGGPVV